MTSKKGLFITVALVLVLSSFNIFLFTNKNGGVSYMSMSGKFTANIPEAVSGINLSIVAFVTQWIILLAILFFAYSRFIKHKQQENINIDYSLLRKKKGRAETDLDTLYQILKSKKILSVDSIAKLFKITKEKALEWAKILESHELVKVEYPAFSAPEVRIYEKKTDKQEESNKEKKGNKEKEGGEKDQKQTSEKDQKQKIQQKEQVKKTDNKEQKFSN